MNFSNFTIAAFLFSSMVACTTTEQANEVLISKFNGTNVDAFFLDYGPPAQIYETSSGEKIHIWAEEPKYFDVAPSSHTTINYVGNTAFANTNYYGGGSIEVQCQLKIVTNTSGVITRIEAHKDTWGAWETSRCHELFGG